MKFLFLWAAEVLQLVMIAEFCLVFKYQLWWALIPGVMAQVLLIFAFLFIKEMWENE